MGGEEAACIATGRPPAGERVGRRDRAGGILGAVDAVAVAGDGPDAGKPLRGNGKAE